MNQCIGCGTDTTNPKYCSNTCQLQMQANARKQQFLEDFYVGKPLQYRTGEWTRNLLVETYGERCNNCQIDQWNSKPIVLEVNHIDGKAFNNTIENLEFLCPNCHSQTDTFRNKNKESDRKNR